ncbi:glycosyltransferase family 2 protein [uncultured Ilyobacter sp.]|uniref:glycosyltransferase family 2 protein n=1 Tax=uncultured Ilyobacter sp. TaxID=544433 RepID=UPI0029C8001E|nr:glycosyltransferase family 2 protein [uncultured Ilyobacter sp.]
MDNISLISVIIPFYNIGDYIKKTVRSLESQTYKNFEVLFINDGSTDNSLEILEKLLKNVDFNYKLINLPKNKGVSNARNTGLVLAEGDYLYFLDADDYLTDNAFEKVMEMFAAENLDTVFFQFRRVDENENLLENYNESFIDVNKIESSRDILFKYINLEIFIYTCSIFYSKRIIKDIFFNEIDYIEDQDFAIRVLLNSHKVGYINLELINYLKREGSIMNSKFNLKILDKIKLFDIFFKQYEMEDSELSELFFKRGAREILWITRAYIKGEKELKIREMKKYIKKNIFNDKIMSHVSKKGIKYLDTKHKMQFFLLKYFPFLFIKSVQVLKVNRSTLTYYKKKGI